VVEELSTPETCHECHNEILGLGRLLTKSEVVHDFNEVVS